MDKKIYFTIAVFLFIILPVTAAKYDAVDRHPTLELQNKAIASSDKISIEQEPKTITKDNKAIIKINNLMESKDYDICLQFYVNLNKIYISGFNKINKGWFDEDLNTWTAINENVICAKKIKDLSNSEIEIKATYDGADTIKYDILILPESYKKDFRAADINDDLLLLDPYIVGSLENSTQIIIRIPFDNSANVTRSVRTTSVPSGNILQYQEYANVSSYATAYGGGYDIPNAVDGQYSTYAQSGFDSTCDLVTALQYTEEYIKLPSETSQIWQIKDDVGTSNLTITTECFNYYTDRVKYSVYLTSCNNCPGACPTYVRYYCYAGSNVLLADRLVGTQTSKFYEDGVYHTNDSNVFSQNNVPTEYMNTVNLNWSNLFGFYGNNSIAGMKNEIIQTQTATQKNVTFNDLGALFNQSAYMNITELTGFGENKSNETICVNVKFGTSTTFSVARFIIGSFYNKQNVISYNQTYKPFFRSTNSTGTCTAYATTSLNDSRYHWICAYRNESECGIYIDGILENSRATKGKINTSTDTFGIGANFLLLSLGGEYYGNFTLKTAHIYNQSLSSDNIKAISKQGNYTYNILNESNASISFNGNDYIMISNRTLSSSTAWTICGFAKTRTQTNSPIFWDFGYYLTLKNDTSNYYNNVVQGAGFINNQWHHSCIVSSGSTIKSYIDGDLKNTTVATHTLSNSVAYYLGKFATSSAFNLNGLIDEIFVFNFALSDSEIFNIAKGYTTSLNLNFFDEDTGLPILFNELDVISDTSATTYHVTNGQQFLTGFAIGQFYTLRYGADGYATKTYYLNITPDINTTINLYNVNSTTGDEITFNVIDNANNKLENAYIQILRYFVSSNSYELVDLVRTDDSGIAKTYLYMNSDYYKFFVYYPYGTLKLETSGNPLYSNTKNFQLDLIPLAATNFNYTFGVYSNFSYVNASNTFRLAFADANNMMHSASIDVYKLGSNGAQLVNHTNVTGASGVFYASISNIENDTNYIATARIFFENNESEIIDSISYTRTGANVFGTTGLIIDLILTVFVIFIAFWNLPIALILTPIPSCFLSAVNIIPISLLPIFLVIEIMFILLARYISENW